MNILSVCPQCSPTLYTARNTRAERKRDHPSWIWVLKMFTVFSAAHVKGHQPLCSRIVQIHAWRQQQASATTTSIYRIASVLLHRNHKKPQILQSSLQTFLQQNKKDKRNIQNQQSQIAFRRYLRSPILWQPGTSSHGRNKNH